ncbi:hypothetical protein J7S33_10905, partial [Saccharothrix algeriensis]
QRGWVWPDRTIAGLIASISLGYPAGTVMMSKQGGDVRFKTRSVEGALRQCRARPADPGRSAAVDLAPPVAVPRGAVSRQQYRILSE